MEYSEPFENFWLKYASTEPTTAKGSKREAWKEWDKVCKRWIKEEGGGDEHRFAQHVYRGYDALMRNRAAARKAKTFTATLPHARTFLSQWRFEEEQIVSTSEYRAMIPEDRQCDCGSDQVIGRDEKGGWICAVCDILAWKEGRTYMNIKPTLANTVKAHPKKKDENWREWSIRVLSTMPVGRKLLERYKHG